eukprot:3804061-Amphidinium_carterae.1
MVKRTKPPPNNTLKKDYHEETFFEGKRCPEAREHVPVVGLHEGSAEKDLAPQPDGLMNRA